jgi:hypothetical protein
MLERGQDARRRVPPSNRRGETWSPPPWHAPATEQEPVRRTTPRRSEPQPRGVFQFFGQDRQIALGFAVAPALTGFLALVFAFLGPLSGGTGTPIALVILVLIQVVGYVVTRRGRTLPLSRSWIVMLLTTVGMTPLLAIQSDLLHEEYVALSSHSATPAILSTLIVIFVMVVAAAWCAGSLWGMAEHTSVVFAPLALLVPGILGITGDISQQDVLLALAESCLLAAGMTALAWSLSTGPRLLVPAIAFAGQFLALWFAGRGPSFPDSSGGIVRFLYFVTLLATLGLVLILPFAAVWLKSGMEQLEEERPRRRGAGEGDSR